MLGGCWLFCDRDRVWYRIAVKLSFAHAEGRNYWQLPTKARLREKQHPADIFYSRDRAFPGLHVSGEMLFSAQEYLPEVTLVSYARWQRR